VYYKYGVVRTNSFVPKLFSIFISARAITLWPFIFIRDDGDERLLTHERIHIAQQAELFVIFFYIMYVLFWFRNIIKYFKEEDCLKKAYFHIPFEKESYINDKNMVYLLNRKAYSWVKYI
tara:strand:+ start:447 stop:806 length:360 start_codon:yes stop_codon:yes gene_type:complete